MPIRIEVTDDNKIEVMITENGVTTFSYYDNPIKAIRMIKSTLIEQYNKCLSLQNIESGTEKVLDN
jgi:hypothetical protein